MQGNINVRNMDVWVEAGPTAFCAAPKKEFPFWEASNKAIFQDFLGFFVSTFWVVIPFEFAWKVDQKVPEYQGKVPPKAPLCTSPGDPPKKEKRTHKRRLVNISSPLQLLDVLHLCVRLLQSEFKV